MIDHIGLTVTKPEDSRRFYEAALAPIGYVLLREIPKEYTGGVVVLGYGVAPKADFWINEGVKTTTPNHVAFVAESRAQVDAFYEAAMAAGGTDNGPPGLRAHYHPTYYGAFVRDPDGHNIEVVCHAAE